MSQTAQTESTPTFIVTTHRIKEILRALDDLEQRTTVLRGSTMNMLVFGEAGCIEVTATSTGHGGWDVAFHLGSARSTS